MKLTPYLYIASIGRSGSTLIANWLTRPDLEQYVFVEPNMALGINDNIIKKIDNFHLSKKFTSIAELNLYLCDKKWGMKEVKKIFINT